jgi:hypothetical protein
MRFFTEHFFSEGQKFELLGNKYALMQRQAQLTDKEERRRAFEIAHKKEWLQQQEEEFARESQLVELVTLPLVLSVTIAFGLASAFLFDGI